MKTGFFHATVRTAAAAALALTIQAAPVAAQASTECRCVDRDGNPVERCSCFRAPRFDGFARAWASAEARPRLGISVDPRQSARRDAAGALVTDVLEDGPAFEAGIREGDVITSIDGRSLFEPLAADAEEDFDLDESIPVQRLLAVARDLEAGQEVVVEYTRDGESRSVTLEAEDLSSSSWGRSFAIVAPEWDADRMREQLRGMTEELRQNPWRFELEGGGSGQMRSFGPGASGLVIGRLGGARYGVELVELNATLGSYFGVDEGVLIADVEEESTLGLEPGDVVVAVGDRAVSTPDRMLRILSSYGDDEEVTFRVRRKGAETSVVGRIGG